MINCLISVVCTYFGSPGATYQPSNDTVLQETVQREAINGVYDIVTTKVVTPAVLVRLCVCGHGCVVVDGCVSLHVCGCVDGTHESHTGICHCRHRCVGTQMSGNVQVLHIYVIL